MKLFSGSVLLILFSMALQAQKTVNAAEILRQAGLRRKPWAEMSLYATIADSGGSGLPSAAYHIFFRGGKALAVSRAMRPGK